MTTAPGTRPGRAESRQSGGTGAPLRRALTWFLLMTSAGSAVTGCLDTHVPAPVARGPLIANQATAVDLDGDGALETVLLAGDDDVLIITDAEVVYRSRGRWQVVQACLGDTNGDGRPEVVALLDADDGRHLGLFAFFAGEYRERLVTRKISPPPAMLEVVERAAAAQDGGSAAAHGAAGAGDLVVLRQEPGPGETEGTPLVLRWNGFSFTRVEDPAIP
jgi:hypothetical protein